LHRLVDKGNTVIVIEHNMEVVKTADWVVDLGPGAGRHGGLVVAEGSVDSIIANKRSFNSRSKPFTTDITTIRTITAIAIPNMEIREMNEIK